MMILKHKFVEFIPNNLEDGVLYISMENSTAIHLCVCGCENKVVTPLSPTQWRLTFNGETITLYPSIGNWSFDCKSHYWITKSEIEFARIWSDREIEKGRKKEKKRTKKYYKKYKSSFLNSWFNF